MHTLPRKSLFAVLLALAICVLAVTAVYAAAIAVLDTYTETTIGSVFLVNEDNWVAQSFVSDATETKVTKVEVNLYGGVQGTVNVDIWTASDSGSSMMPDQFYAQVGQYNANTLTSDQDALVTFSGLDITLSPSTDYFLVVYGGGMTSSDDHFYWTGSTCLSNCNKGTAVQTYNATGARDGGIYWTNNDESNPARAIVTMGSETTSVRLSGFDAHTGGLLWVAMGLGAVLLLGAAVVLVRRR